MRKKVIMITGAVGEIGQALVSYLTRETRSELLTMDLNPKPAVFDGSITHVQGDILDNALLSRLVSEYGRCDYFSLRLTIQNEAADRHASFFQARLPSMACLIWIPSIGIQKCANGSGINLRPCMVATNFIANY